MWRVNDGLPQLLDMSPCLACGQDHRGSHLTCFNCWKQHDGNAIRDAIDAMPVAKRFPSLVGTVNTLRKNRAKPTPATIVKLSYMATAIDESKGSSAATEKVLELLQQKPKKQPGGKPKATKKTSPALVRNNRPETLAQVRGSDLPALLEEICTGQTVVDVPDEAWAPRNEYKATAQTKSGHIVRSQQEVRIADFLYAQRLCFAYEPVVAVQPPGQIHPDFFLPAQEGPDVKRGLVFEHFGMLDKPAYRLQAIKKMAYLKRYCDTHDYDLWFTTAPEEGLTDSKLKAMLGRFISGFNNRID